jgi:hypothetical protein
MRVGVVRWGIPSVADIVVRELTESLGPFTARNAIKTFARKAANKEPAQLAREDLPKVLDALRPMLRTLCGAEKCDEMLAQIKFEVGT